MNIIGEKYKIIKILGKGNMGCVLLVEDILLKKKYAMKIVEKKSVERAEALKKEAECLKTLTDRRLPYIVDVVEANTFLGVVMEYVEGVTLEDYLAKRAPLEEEEALVLFKEITDILSYLHKQRPAIVFRDLKPSNIIVQPEGSVRLLDFGAAMEGYGEMKDAVTVGTYGYSAPEQVCGKAVIPASDIYALGAIYYYMLTGVNPALPPYQVEDIRKISLTVSERSCKLVKKCCEKEPKDRFFDATSLQKELEHFSVRKEEQKAFLSLIIYYVFSFATAAYTGFSMICQGKQARVDWEQVFCIVLCGITCTLWRKNMVEKYQRERFVKRREWNILYTEKKNVGLWLLVLTIFFTTGCVKEEKTPFYLNVINEEGMDVLIKDGSYYQAGENLNFSISLEQGALYEVYFYKCSEDSPIPTEHYFTFGM